MSGWVKFHRKIEEWEWYTDANTFRLFFHLVLKANHKSKNWKGVQIERGQLITSTDKLAEELNLTRQKIRTSLNKLKSTSEITIKATNKFTLITVENYDVYQSSEEESTNEITIKPTNKQPSNNHQITTNKNVKNDKNEKEDNIYSSVINYLNEKTGKKFTTKAQKNISLIKARQKEGRELEDFKKVIDVKSKQWLNTNMEMYLRPETLFGNKFESYLNQDVWVVEEKKKTPGETRLGVPECESILGERSDDDWT